MILRLHVSLGRLLFPLIVIWTAVTIQPASAVTVWNGDGVSSSWFDPDNWDTDTVPVSTEEIVINGPTFDVVIDTTDAVSEYYTFTEGSLTINPGRTWTASATDTSSVGANFTINVNGGTVAGLASPASAVNMSGTVNVSGDGVYNPSSYYLNVNGGTFNLGDATSSGTMDSGRITRANASSTIRGWGLVRHGGWADNWFYGKTIADGWSGSEDRELLFQMNGISDSYAFRMQGDVNTDRGFYAINRGYVTLPSLRYSSSVVARGWGSQGSGETQDEPTAVNSFWMTFENIDHTGNKFIEGKLLASDVSSLPGISLDVDGIITAIYEMTPDSDFLFSGETTFTHRYDHILAGAKEAELTVYRYDEGTGYWRDLAEEDGYTLTRDLTNNRLALTGFSGLESISGFFAVGAGVQGPPPVPEPSGFGLVLLGAGVLLRRRKQRQMA